MTKEHQASRTLVKSPPELWAECSDAGSLARHLGEFGEIRITRLEPETSVAWEGEHASGTVTIEPSGWGTRVTLTAQAASDDGATAEEAAAVQEAPSVQEAATMQEALSVQEALSATTPAADSAAAPTPDAEEEIDAMVEETTAAEPDPPVAAAAAPLRGRWRRLIGRTRAWFAAASPETEPASPADAESPGAISEAPILEPGAPDTPDTPEAMPAEVLEAHGAVLETAGAVLEAGEAPASEPVPGQSPGLDPDGILAAALDSLGAAHHRPFSRA